ncbi:hypothetical protein DXN04_10260 [Chitinophaga silvisoli]|uniref:Uncharacterized protein n=1 Tax=Chitinophaga silvisoli TaxID=2291814 RepID=A0A3E1P6I5_9BACT|nr:hypothetical protein DXN04_10260 [Chitinophaga silvisoli]
MGVKRVPFRKNTTDNTANSVIESCIKKKESTIQPQSSIGIILQFRLLKTTGFMLQTYEITL